MLDYDDAQIVAYALYDAGFLPSYSSNYFDQVTAGFGECDSMGDWQYPLKVSINGCYILPEDYKQSKE